MKSETVDRKLSAIIDTNSRKEKKDLIRSLFNPDTLTDSGAIVALLTDDVLDDSGVGKRTVKNTISADYDAYSTVSDAIREDFEPESGNSFHIETLFTEASSIAQLSGNEQKKQLKDTLNNTEHPHLVTQMLLNDMDTGVSVKTVVNAVLTDKSKEERTRIHGLYANLSNLISDLNNRSLRTSPENGRAFRPMLAKPNGEPSEDLVYEPKLDGYRLILHVNDKTTKAYTRRLNDVTESLPELENVDLYNGIYDCEVLAEDGTYKSTSERIGTKDVQNPDTEMTFWIFDMVSADGVDMSVNPLTSRRESLKGFVDDRQVENVEIIPQFDSYEDAKDYAVNRDLEGVMCKDPESEYLFGKRSGKWRKIKYTDETADDRIVDMKEGEGRLTGSMGKIRLESADGVDLGWCGTGFTDDQRQTIWDNKNEWLGEIVEVTFEDYDDGLRFPRYERHRDEGQPDTEDKIKSLVE